MIPNSFNRTSFCRSCSFYIHFMFFTCSDRNASGDIGFITYFDILRHNDGRPETKLFIREFIHRNSRFLVL